VQIEQSMSWRAVWHSCQPPKSPQISARSLITHIGGPRRKHLVCWLKCCVIAETSESRGLPFEPEPYLIARALDFLTCPAPIGVVPLGRLRGIRLHAYDIDRTWGDGQEIRGRAIELMMAAVGRNSALVTLDGPGLPLLRRRL
jgi:hypothetical protein